MADSILRLKVDSQEYDAKIKRASQGLQQYVDGCRKAGGTLEVVEKETLKFVQDLGKMDTVAKTAKGRIGEMSSAFVELSRVEKQLTDQERQSPVGKALAESLQQLKQRTIEAKQELEGLNSQISGKLPSMGGGGSALDNAMSGLTGKFAMGNLYAEAAMKGVEAMESLGQKVVDVANRGMQLSIQAEGIEQAFNRLNRPDILDKVREATHGTVSDLELMKAAVKFDDFNLNIDEMGTLLAFAQKKAKDTGQSVDYMVDSITTGLGRQSLMILDNLGLSAAEIKAKMKETGDMTTAVGEIIREQMSQAGEYTETASDRIARANAENENALKALGDQMRETFGDKTWEELSIGLETELVKSLTDVARGIENIMTAAGLADSAFTKWLTSATTLMGGLKLAIESALGPLGQMLAMLETFGQKSFKEIVFDTAVEGVQETVANTVNSIKKITNKRIPPRIPGTGGRGGRGGGGNTTTTQELTREQEIQKQIAALELEYTKATMERRMAIQETVIALDAELKKIKELKKEAHGDNREFIIKGNPNAQFLNQMNAGSLDKVISNIQAGLKDADFGSALAQSLQTNLVDAKLFKNVLDMALKNGIDMGDFDMAGFWQKIINGESIPQEAWASVWEEMSRQLGKPIDVNFMTGDAKETDAKEENGKDSLQQQTQKLLGGINSVASGLQQMGVKLPDGVNKILSIGNGLMTVIQGVQSVISIFSTSTQTANTIAVGLNTGALYALTVAMWANTAASAIPFAGGGIVPHAAAGFFVPGNNFSGDRVHMALNSGELVLNKAQQGNLASQLTDNGGEISDVRPYTTGENIILGINAHFRRSGQGEIVTTSMLRRMGLT